MHPLSSQAFVPELSRHGQQAHQTLELHQIGAVFSPSSREKGGGIIAVQTFLVSCSTSHITHHITNSRPGTSAPPSAREDAWQSLPTVCQPHRSSNRLLLLAFQKMLSVSSILAYFSLPSFMVSNIN